MRFMNTGLHFGLSRVDITPQTPIAMGGYSIRCEPFEEVHDPLSCTILYLSDGNREVWIGSADLVQFPDGAARDAGIESLCRRLGCGAESVFLNATHTHGGPLTVVDFGIPNTFNLTARSGESRQRVEAYCATLWQQIGDAMEAARTSARPGSLSWAEGNTSFPMNRRHRTPKGVINAPNPTGPVDNRLRLIGVKDRHDTLQAILPILACHPTATGAQRKITADFVGAWRKQFETRHPHVTMLFLQGCGADARPAATADGDRWKTLPHDALEALGAHLTAETESAIKAGWKSLGTPGIAGGYTELQLPCAGLVNDTEKMRELASNPNPWMADFGRECLRRLNTGERIPDHVPLRLYGIKLASGCTLLGMDCEPLYGLGRHLETTLAAFHPVVLGYTNGCTGYVPDTAALYEGGYECESYLWGPWSGPLLPHLEHLIEAAARNLLKTLSI